MKRVLSLVLALVLVLGMMPTFAASATGAEELKAYGFVSGGDNGDLMVNKTLTRGELAVILTDLYGQKDQAANTVFPANFTDVNDHWSRPYVAYAQESGWVSGYPDGTYKPEGTVTSQELAAAILKVLGYDVPWDGVVDFAATQGINVGSETSLTRGEAFESFWQTVNTPKKGAEVSLGVELGKLESGTPAAGDLAVERVYSDNLKQIFVEFNQPVDKDSATTVANYTIKDDDGNTLSTTENSEDFTAELKADNKTVVITFVDAKVPEQQDTFKVTVEDVKTADESKSVVKSEKEIQFLDTQLPEILNAEVVGSNAIKVTFSEPVKKPETSSFSVNDGKYYVSTVTPQKNNTELIVKLYTTLKAGDLPFEVKTSVTDYAGFSAVGKTFNLPVVEDTTPPAVTGFKSAKETELVLTWSEDLDKANVVSPSQDSKSSYYHTNSSNYAKTVEVDGNEMTLTFDSARKLGPGTNYVYVLKDAVRDLWGNKNTQQMQSVEVVLDKTAPEATSVKYVDETNIKLVFDEEVDFTTLDKKNFTLLDKDGKDTEMYYSFGSTKGSGKEVSLRFTKDLDGDYSLVVEGVKDLSNNEMAKTTIPFTATDTKAPTFPATGSFYTINQNYVFSIKYSDDMATSGEYSVLDKEKYVFHFGGKDYELKDIDNAVINNVNGKTVEIKIPTDNKLDTSTDPDSPVNFTAGTTLDIARVADTAGNVTDLLSTSSAVTFGAAAEIKVTDFEVTGERQVKMTFNDRLEPFAAQDILIGPGTSGVSAADKATYYSYSQVNATENKDGNTVVTFDLAETMADGVTKAAKLTSGTTSLNFVVQDTVSDNDSTPEIYEHTASKNMYGTDLKAGTNSALLVSVTDSFAPVVAEDGVVTKDFDNDGKIDHILVTYQEPVFTGSIAYDKFDVAGYDVIDAFPVATASDVPTATDTATVFTDTVNKNSATVADGPIVVIQVKETDATTDADVTPSVAIAAGIQDTHGNTTEAVTKDVANGALKLVSAKVTTAGTNPGFGNDIGDVLTLTFSQPVDKGTLTNAATTDAVLKFLSSSDAPKTFTDLEYSLTQSEDKLILTTTTASTADAVVVGDHIKTVASPNPNLINDGFGLAVEPTTTAIAVQ